MIYIYLLLFSTMGCSVSSTTHVQQVSNCTVNTEPSSENTTGLPPTGGLQLILEQAFLRANFRSFVENTWIPSNNDNSVFYLSEAKNISINCIDFWTDIKDFTAIKQCSFQKYRACHIYEKYVMHGESSRSRALLCCQLFFIRCCQEGPHQHNCRR